MILISGIIAVFAEFLLLPGALNTLETRFKSHFITRIALLVIACYLGFLLTWFTTYNGGGMTWFDGLCKTTETMFMFEIVLVLISGAIILLLGVTNKQPELVLLLMGNLIGIIYMVTSNDWLITITGWELFNLSLYLLVSLSSMSGSGVKSSNSLSAAMKYFLLSALVTTFMLLAVSFIYSLTGTTNYDNLSFSLLMMQYKEYYSNYLHYMLIATLLWKLGAAPVHNWAPDLYDTITMPVVLWMIIIPKLAVFGLIMQISHLNLLGGGGAFTLEKVFAFIGVITVLTGSIGIASQWRIIRLISYSAITHLGFLLLTITSYNSTNYLYYIAIYAITNINLFAILVKYTLGGNPHDLSGMYRMNLTMSLSWALSFFSLAGIPPLAGFYAKFLILSSLLNSRTTINLFIIAIIASALTLANYLNLVKLSHFYLPNQHTKTNYLVSYTTVSYLISLLTFSLLVLGWSVFI